MSEEIETSTDAAAGLSPLFAGESGLTVSQRCWRILAPKWAYNPLSGAGAARFGGRFNPKGIPALYLSETIDTAFAEYQQDLLVRPGTFCAYQVDVIGIVDLCNAQVCKAVSVDRETLLSPWKEILLVQQRTPPTWDLSLQLLNQGFAGVRVPSVQREAGVNIVLWRWNDDPSRQVSVLDPQGELPRDQTSWR
ncbi:MAG: RES family NAD+ phosphorylase [Thermosynechococcaceae cyanobacterium]